MVYKVFQLKHNDEGDKYLFLPYKEGRVAPKSLYDEVYSGEVEPSGSVMSVLESLYMKFNLNHPSDFRGHSLSVSDIIELDGKNYYCDSFGFVEVK